MVARCVEDTSKFGDIMPVGFGDDGMIDDELAEESGRRRWNDHGAQWVGKEGKKDGFVSTLTILPEGKPLWDGPCRKVDVEEVDVRPTGGKGSENDRMHGKKKSGKREKEAPTPSRTAASWRGGMSAAERL